jgi:hypothetical protein
MRVESERYSGVAKKGAIGRQIDRLIVVGDGPFVVYVQRSCQPWAP